MTNAQKHTLNPNTFCSYLALGVIGFFTSISASQTTYTVPPDPFPTQAQLNANPNSTINVISFTLYDHNPPINAIDLNNAIVNVLGEYLPDFHSQISNGIFNVTGQLGQEGAWGIYIDSEINIAENGMFQEATLRGNSFLQINGGEFDEDFIAEDFTVVEINAGTFGADTAANFHDNTQLIINGGAVVQGAPHGHDNATLTVNGGTIDVVNPIRGFKTVTITGGIWVQSKNGTGNPAGFGGAESVAVSGNCLRIGDMLAARMILESGTVFETTGAKESMSVVLSNHTNMELRVDEQSEFVFTVTGPPCLADLNCTADLNWFDVSIFLTAFIAGEPVADMNGDTSYDFFDISAFLGAFAAGCP